MSATTIRVPQPGRAIRGLIIANIVAYVLFLVALRVFGQDLMSMLALSPQSFFEGAVWQPFTSIWIHSPSQVGHLLGNMLYLWLFGSEVESVRGTRFALLVYLAGALGGAAFTLLLGLGARLFPEGSSLSALWWDVHLGASGGVIALTACWGGLFWYEVRNFLFLGPMRVRTFMFILIGIEFLIALSYEKVSSTSHLAGMAIGLAFGRGLLRGDWVNRLFARRTASDGGARRFRVLDGGKSSRPGRNQNDEWIN